MQSKLNSTSQILTTNGCLTFVWHTNRDVYVTDIEISGYAEREHRYCDIHLYQKMVNSLRHISMASHMAHISMLLIAYCAYNIIAANK